MSEELTRFAIERGLAMGAEYSEARIHRNVDEMAILRNGIPEPSIIMDVKGIGIRIICNGSMAFAATNSMTRDSIRDLVDRAVKRAKNASIILKKQIKFSDEKVSKKRWGVDEKKRLDDVDIPEFIKILKELDTLVKHGKKDVEFPNRLFFLKKMIEEKRYMNSDGANLESRVPRMQFYSILAAKYNGNNTTITIPSGYAQLGESGGYEVLDRFDIFNYVPKTADDMTDAIKAEKKPPEANLDVILGPDVSGLVSHESSGHPGEADRILGREAAQAGESYLKIGDVGKRIGGDEANVSDDPSLPGSMGYYLYDDEGIEARKRKLIDSGVISELLLNRETAMEMSTTSNASARTVEYDREPIIRMANTFIEPGDYSFEELIEDVKLGVYIKSFMEWNIDDKRLNQRYVGMQAYLIENGLLKDAIKDPVLEITTPRFWSSIDARGNDLSFTAATCGKGDPMQGAPVWTGGPHVRLRNVRIGSR